MLQVVGRLLGVEFQMPQGVERTPVSHRLQAEKKHSDVRLGVIGVEDPAPLGEDLNDDRLTAEQRLLGDVQGRVVDAVLEPLLRRGIILPLTDGFVRDVGTTALPLP